MADISVEPEALATDGDPLILQTVQLQKNGSPGVGLGWVQVGAAGRLRVMKQQKNVSLVDNTRGRSTV